MGHGGLGQPHPGFGQRELPAAFAAACPRGLEPSEGAFADQLPLELTSPPAYATTGRDAPGEFVPSAVVDFIGRQLDMDGYELADYAVRSETRHEHLAELRRLYGFRSFAGGAAHELGDRLREEAPRAQSNEDLVRRFVEACRHTRTILPATTTIERICADALVDAERRIEARIAERVPPGLRRDLEHLLEETVDAGVTRFVWLRQFEPGSNSAAANRLLDRLEHLRRLDVPEGLFHDIPPHRITRLRRQGERYFADGLRELPDNRRLAILAVCAVEWEMFLADAVVETHDRIVGRTYREAARTCEGQLGDETAAVREALRAFAELGTALIGARDTGEALDAVIADRPGWEGLGDLVARAAALANTVASDPLNHVLGGYSRFRRYTPRMLRTLDIEASPVAKPLLEAVDVLRSDATARPTGFLRPNSKWSRLLRTQSDHRLWETAVFFHLRDALTVVKERENQYSLSAEALPDGIRELQKLVEMALHDVLHDREVHRVVAVHEDVAEAGHVAECSRQHRFDPAGSFEKVEQPAIRARLTEPLVGDDMRGRVEGSLGSQSAACARRTAPRGRRWESRAGGPARAARARTSR